MKVRSARGEAIWLAKISYFANSLPICSLAMFLGDWFCFGVLAFFSHPPYAGDHFPIPSLAFPRNMLLYSTGEQRPGQYSVNTKFLHES